MMVTLWVDFETRSPVDISAHGVYRYMEQASALCMAYAFDDGQVTVWRPGQSIPYAVKHFRGQIRAHNATFERLVFWQLLGWPFKLAQFYCTATQARANGMPGALENVGRFTGVSMRKDFAGAQLVQKVCCPPYNDDPALLEQLFAYCAQDVRAMRAMSQSIRDLTQEELTDYHINERINDRGLLIDMELAEAATTYASAEVVEVQARLQKLTEGEIASARSHKLAAWVHARLPDEMKLVMTSAGKLSMDKSVRKILLESDVTPSNVVSVVECAEAIYASSVSKFKRMHDLASTHDNRLRGAFVFNGAPATGRISSYGAQVHNMPRACAKDPEKIREDIIQGRVTSGVSKILRSMLRPCVKAAPGKSLIMADWSNIEACVNPWLADEPQAAPVLEAFRRGEDIYVATAKLMFSGEITEVLRQVGKVAVLACGYGGGAGAYAKMAANSGVHIDLSQAETYVAMWRKANPWGPDLWDRLRRAYTCAMMFPGQHFKAGRVEYVFENRHLWAILPSGRRLCYPFAKVDGREVTYAKASWKPKKDAAEWPRGTLWYGLACENNTQAVANDLLREACRSIPGIVATVHDEIVVEAEDVEQAKAHMHAVMTTPPSWGAGIPLAVKFNVGERFGKG